MTLGKDTMSTNTIITMYGTAWCGDCIRTRQQLTRAGVLFQDVDIEENADAATMAHDLAGSRRIPVVQLPDGRVLVEPSHTELAAALAG